MTELHRALEREADGRLLLGLDFDGTLSPLAPTPDEARLPGRAKAALLALLRRGDCDLAVLSGRALPNVRALVGLRGLHYAGNHGLEAAGPGYRWTHPAARAASAEVLEVARRLRPRLRGRKGVLLQYKRLSLSVHFRLADRALAEPLRRLILDSLRPKTRLRLFGGHDVWELRPKVDWNKGHALLALGERLGGGRTLLLAGDDRTDEEGFRTLGGRAFCVRVGAAKDTRARFRLKDPPALWELLERLSRARAARRRC
jgi:trehalose-phosphatase